MKFSVAIATALAATAFAYAPAARAGLIIKSVEKRTDTHKTTTSTLYIDGNRVAIVGDGGGMIFDGAKQLSITYDLKHKMYVEMTAAQTKAMVQKAKAMGDKMMRKELAHMSPKMRKQVRAQMAKEAKGPTYKRTGPMRTVGKWHCTPVAKYNADGAKQNDMCVATFAELGLTAADRKVFAAMAKYEAASGPDADNSSSSGPLSKLAQKQLGLNGFPIEEHDNFSTSTVISVTHGAVPASVFQVPKGLKKRKMPGM